MIITIFLKRYYFGTIMNCKKSLFMACWTAMAATAQAQITIDIDAQHRDKLRLNNTINRNFDRLNGEIGGGYLDD